MTWLAPHHTTPHHTPIDHRAALWRVGSIERVLVQLNTNQMPIANSQRSDHTTFSASCIPFISSCQPSKILVLIFPAIALPTTSEKKFPLSSHHRYHRCDVIFWGKMIFDFPRRETAATPLPRRRRALRRLSRRGSLRREPSKGSRTAADAANKL